MSDEILEWVYKSDPPDQKPWPEVRTLTPFLVGPMDEPYAQIQDAILAAMCYGSNTTEEVFACNVSSTEDITVPEGIHLVAYDTRIKSLSIRDSVVMIHNSRVVDLELYGDTEIFAINTTFTGKIHVDENASGLFRSCVLQETQAGGVIPLNLNVRFEGCTFYPNGTVL